MRNQRLQNVRGAWKGIPACRSAGPTVRGRACGRISAELVFGFVLVLSLTAPALAANDLKVETTSFLRIIYEGAEIPGAIIGMMSLATMTIIIEHFWTIRRRTIAPVEEIEMTRKMIEGRQFKESIDYIRERRSMFADVLTAGLRHGRHGFDAMHEAAEERAGAWSARLFRRAEYLNIIGHLGPLMGLLGTVLGMIESFGQMQASHGAYKPEQLAGGISLALVNTFLGLSVAIVAIGFFGICRNRVDTLTTAAHAAVTDLLEYFRPGPAVAGTAGPGMGGGARGNPTGRMEAAAAG